MNKTILIPLGAIILGTIIFVANPSIKYLSSNILETECSIELTRLEEVRKEVMHFYENAKTDLRVAKTDLLQKPARMKRKQDARTALLEAKGGLNELVRESKDISTVIYSTQKKIHELELDNQRINKKLTDTKGPKLTTAQINQYKSDITKNNTKITNIKKTFNKNKPADKTYEVLDARWNVLQTLITEKTLEPDRMQTEIDVLEKEILALPARIIELERIFNAAQGANLEASTALQNARVECGEDVDGTNGTTTGTGWTNTSSGTCSDGSSTTKEACEQGTVQCTVSEFGDEYSCTNAGHTWGTQGGGGTWTPTGDGGNGGNGDNGDGNGVFKCCVCFQDEGEECNSAGHFDNIGEVRAKRCSDFFAEETGCNVQKTVPRDRTGNNVTSKNDVRDLCGSEEELTGKTISTSFFYAGHSCSVMVGNECVNATYSILNTYKKSVGKIKSTHDGCATFPVEKRSEANAHFSKLVSDLQSADMTAEITFEGNQLISQTDANTGEKLCETAIGFRICQNGIDVILQDCPQNNSACTEPGKSIDCKDPATDLTIHPVCQQLPAGVTLNWANWSWHY